MGHYSDYYDQRDEEESERRRVKYKAALTDLINFGGHNAQGKSVIWTFNELGLEKDYEALKDKLKARLYDLGGK